MGDNMPAVPPIQVAGQEYLRKKKKQPVNPMTVKYGRKFPTVDEQENVRLQEQAEGKTKTFGDIKRLEASGDSGQATQAARLRKSENLNVPTVEELAQLKAMGMSRPAPTGGAKRAEGEAERDAAHKTAVTAAPEGQPDNLPVTEATNTGGGGPTVHLLPGGGGSITVPAGTDPATQRGGFADPNAKKAGYRAEEDRRIAAMPEEASMEYGPESATGGHSWTRRTPGRREARYDASRYRRQTEARQSSEDAAISGMDAQAAAAAAGISRSKALEGDPFAPEKASVAEAVGEQRAKSQPKIRGMEMAGQLLTTYNEAKQKINNDPSLDEAQKRELIDRAQREFYMAMTGIAGRDVSPRHEPSMFGGALPPDEDA